MSHWLSQEFERREAPLAPNLVQMLDEHPHHRTERRGCGFTQATRFLAERINAERSSIVASDLTMFAGVAINRIETAARYWIEHGCAEGWRRYAGAHDPRERELFRPQCEQLDRLRDALSEIAPTAPTAGSRMLLQLMAGIFHGSDGGAVRLPPMPVKPEIGSCSQAEEFFLEIAHGKIRRGGSVNVIVDRSGRPVLLEKMNLGESHSAISLRTLELNRVELPPGSLFALTHAATAEDAPRCNAGRHLGIPDLQAARFLRLTTLAVPPAIRKETFTAQVESQVRSTMLSPLSTTLEHLASFADSCMERAA
jgi:hypothetical protein